LPHKFTSTWFNLKDGLGKRTLFWSYSVCI
jgi:hypothetical protein